MMLCLSPVCVAAAEDAIQLELSAAVLAGDISGYMQTPAGGQPGRSDIRRPTFSELDINSVTAFEIDLGVSMGRHGFYLGADIVRESERSVLHADLLSQWQQFHTGDSVRADAQLDWFRLGYLRSFRSRRVSGLTYELGGDITMLSFHYELTNTTVDVDREYRRAGYRLGGIITYDLGGGASLELAGFLPLRGGGTADITTVDVTARWQLSPSVSVFGGAAYREIDFEDGQTFPNHVLAEMAPMALIGFSVSTE